MPEDLIQTVLGDTCAAQRSEPVTSHLLVVDEEEMKILNRRHTGRDETTDVLAFDDGEEDPDTGITHLGDIIINGDLALREAASRNLPPTDEITLYALHGLLHLLGMRDKTETERKKMQAVQRRIFAQYDLQTDC